MLSRYNQKDLAFLLGVPRRTLSRWESWLRTPSVYHAIGLEVALHRLSGEIFPDYRQGWIETINRRAQTLQNIKDKKSNDNVKR